MDVNEVMQNFTGENGMAYGVDTAIKALRPGCRYEITCAGGSIIYHKWWDPNDLPPPEKPEVDEYPLGPLNPDVDEQPENPDTPFVPE